MKFLNVYCEVRQAEVHISLDKIVLITQESDNLSHIALLSGGYESVKVALPAEALVRKINGEDKEAVGFRIGR